MCLGDGAGGFSCQDINSDGIPSLGVVLGDFDGDDILDALFANNANANEICLSDGVGNFDCQDLSGTRSQYMGVGDVDGDGNLDY